MAQCSSGHGPETRIFPSRLLLLHHFAAAPKRLSGFTAETCFSTAMLLYSVPHCDEQQIVHRLYFFKAPRANGLEHLNTGCPLSAKILIISSAVTFHFPSVLWERVPYHFSSSPGPRKVKLPSGKIFHRLIRRLNCVCTLLHCGSGPSQCHCTST